MKTNERFKIGLQYLLPQHALTRLLGCIASAKLGKFTTFCIRRFAKHYQVNMSEARHPDFTYYQTFNEFFTRELAKGMRPIISEADVLSHPADACVSQFGPIEKGTIVQAKGHHYTVLDLLGGDEALALQFQEGQFATLYLSPKDYHRVHMPCDAVLRKMTFVAGDLFSVNPLTAQHVPNLFARNERLVCVFDTEFGPMVQVLVGATIVGSMEVTWKGEVRAPNGHKLFCWDYPAEGEGVIRFEKGQEMGRFKLGSTVINLFPANAIVFDESMDLRAPTQRGSAYARRV